MTFKTLDLAEPDKLLENHQKLGQYMATPIAGNTRQSNPRASQPVSSHVFDFRSGNDISSSILYTLGLVSQRSGQLAPLCLLLVCGVLHFFRYVYSEVCDPLRSTLPFLPFLASHASSRPAINDNSLFRLSLPSLSTVVPTTYCSIQPQNFQPVLQHA